jgi:hypothetical protein
LQRAKHLVFILVAVLALSGCAKSVLPQHLSVKQTPAQLASGDVQMVNEESPGQRVDLARYVVLGKYTVIEFTSDT